REEKWDLIAGRSLDQVRWAVAQATPRLQKLEKHRKRPRKRHEWAVKRHVIIHEKLADGWEPVNIFQFLSEQHHVTSGLRSSSMRLARERRKPTSRSPSDS